MKREVGAAERDAAIVAGSCVDWGRRRPESIAPICYTGAMSQDHSARVNLGKAAPDLYPVVLDLERRISERCGAAGLSKGLVHLLKLRASQINGCSFCVRMHARDAAAVGESADRIYVVAAWRESQYFTDKERAALALIEAVTLIADGQVPDAVYAEAAAVLSSEEIAAVEWLGVMINIWNRIAIASRYPVGPE